VWRAIDAGCVCEIEDELLHTGKLFFRFADHWSLGAHAAYHWYRIGIATQWALIVAPIEARGLVLETKRLTVGEAISSTVGVIFTTFGEDELIGICADGLTIQTEGVDLAQASFEEKSRLEHLARTMCCECDLCNQLRLTSES